MILEAGVGRTTFNESLNQYFVEEFFEFVTFQRSVALITQTFYIYIISGALSTSIFFIAKNYIQNIVQCIHTKDIRNRRCEMSSYLLFLISLDVQIDEMCLPKFDRKTSNKVVVFEI